MRQPATFLALATLVACGSVPMPPRANEPAPSSAANPRNEASEEPFREVVAGQGTLVVPAAHAPRFYRVHGFFAPDGFFSLTDANVRAALEALDPAIGALPHGMDDASGYYRHLLGVVVEGRRSVFVAGFCRARDDWREPVSVEDGGTCYFEGYFDLETGAYRDLRVHGAA